MDSNDEAIYSDADYNEEDDEERGNLTRQLAETAVSVREMSKQLGELSLNFFVSFSFRLLTPRCPQVEQESSLRFNRS